MTPGGIGLPWAVYTMSGHVIIFSLSEIANNEHGFAEKIAHLDTQGVWKALDHSRLFRTYPFSAKEAHIRHWVYVYQKS